MHHYLLGYKDGCNIESWACDMFFLDKNECAKQKALISSKTMPPVDTKLNLKQLKEYGFEPWLGKKPQSDYYIIREFGFRTEKE